MPKKTNSKDGCPHLLEMQVQSTWCCYVHSSIVSKEDCKTCKYGKTVLAKI